MFKIAFITLAFALVSPSLVIAQEGFLDESFALGSGDGPY